MPRSIVAALCVALGAFAPSVAGAGVDTQEPARSSYIVVLNPGAARAAGEPAANRPLVSVLAQELARSHDGLVASVYQHALKGFAVQLTEAQAAALAADSRVAYVEPDQVITIDATQSPATWGLDRIDQRDLPLNNTYTYNQTGQNVHAYVIDTGIRATHQEFGGRVSGTGFTAINDGGGTNDCNGHGTHVSGTVGGATYGVAKSVTLHAVRVLGCNGSGPTSGVIAGVDWVTQNHVKPAVANMSLGGGISSALDTAIANSINAGVTYAVAAGNSNTNACNGSPARVASALTVGSTTSSDARSSFSNFGTFAPGSSITSAWYTSNTATNTISGTSMATPHVAGAVALYLQANPGASPSAAASALLGGTTANKVTNPGSGSPNRLLYSLFVGGAPGDGNPPTTSITSPANGATVSGTVNVTANASDDVGVTRVDLYADGSLVGSDTSSPYAIAWNTTTASNGGHSLQTRAVDAAGNVGSSATVNVTVSNGGGGGGGELIVNGGFEGSAAPWTLTGNAVWSTGGNQHSGTGYTILGGGNNNSGSEYQTVTIPSTHNAGLTFWLNVTTNEGLATAYDFFYVEVRSTSGALLGTLGSFSNRNGTASPTAYTQRSFNLAAWRGQTVRVQFRATTDFIYTTTFRVDDVSLPWGVGVSETAVPLDQQLEEIRAQLAWVRDYL